MKILLCIPAITLMLCLIVFQLALWGGLAWLAWITFPYGFIAFMGLILWMCYKEEKRNEKS